MIVVPLGVASATPTAVRHLPAVALWREGSVFLFDCGENAQMRMLQAGMKRSKIESICISHFDVDHFSGLIGLLTTLQLQRREKTLKLIGPKGLKKYIEWNLKFIGINLVYDLEFVELKEGFEEERVVDEDEYYIEARPLKHSRFCVGYRFQEKDKPGKVDAEKAKAMGISKDEDYKTLKSGKDVKLDDGTVVKADDIVGHPRPGDSFAYVTDTEYSPNAVKLAMNTNILYHEATFSKTLTDKALETGHSTTSDAARVATEAQTKLLVLGHFSARYTNAYTLLKEARDEFYPTWLANELKPIFTDPTHERGIITPKVEISEVSDHKGGGGRHKGSRGGSRDDRGGKNFRKRRGDSRGSSSRGRRSSSSSSGRGNRSEGSDRYQSRGDNKYRKTYGSNRYNNKFEKSDDNKSDRSKPNYTPRSYDDDFDRF